MSTNPQFNKDNPIPEDEIQVRFCLQKARVTLEDMDLDTHDPRFLGEMFRFHTFLTRILRKESSLLHVVGNNNSGI
jgi:hypothetical protein